MKALYFNQHGNFENLTYGEVEDPAVLDGEVLLRVKACALNHLDLWVLQGWPGLKLEMPHIGGADIAGEIVEVGNQAQNGMLGKSVVVCPGYATSEDEWTASGEESLSPSYKIFGEGRRGGFCEFISVPSKLVREIPNGFSYVDACASQLALLTTWRMLKNRANVLPGESVLIVGAGGGVNSLCVQVAKLFGARVIALTSSEEKLMRAKALGADEVINYMQIPSWSREVKRLTDGRGVDVVVDNVGEKTINESINALARGGRLVTVGNTSGYLLKIDNRYIFSKQLSILGSTMGSFADYCEAMECIWSRKIKPVIDSELPLIDGRLGYEILERGEQFGKVVLVP